MATVSSHLALTKNDFVSETDIRWCPGCGDYAILNAVQKVFPALGIPKEKFVVVSGIGCSSRFPYYMNTYGFHSIHGRAPTVATGIKVTNPDLSVWLITGDGDGLSIGGNHLLHILRRNVGVKILLFNNKIYGLTKGQYSPTSELGKKTKTSPQGSLEHPINPLSFAIASEATFVARTMDTNPKHMAEVFKQAGEHEGTAFVEIMQNCVIFNDKVWDSVAGRSHRDETLLDLQENQPLLFGKDKNKGLSLNGLTPEVVTLNENGITIKDILVHRSDEDNIAYAYMLSQLTHPEFPIPIGVLKNVDRPVYEKKLMEQHNNSIQQNGVGNVQQLIQGTEYWEVNANQEIQSTTSNKKAVQSEEMQIMREIAKQETTMVSSPWISFLNSPVSKLLDICGEKVAHSLQSTSTVAEVINLMQSKKIGCIPIFDEKNIVGVVSRRDIINKVILTAINRDQVQVAAIISRAYVFTSNDSVAHIIKDLSSEDMRYFLLQDQNSGNASLISTKKLLYHILNLLKK